MSGYPVDSVRAGPEPGGRQPAEPPPHPRLRRLLALGGAAARTAESLAYGLAALERIAREPDRWPLLDELGGALVAVPDLAALFAGVAGETVQEEGAEPEEAARAGRGSARPPAGVLERPTGPARARAAAPGARRRAHIPPGHSTAGASRALLERAAAALAAEHRLGLPDAVNAPVDGSKAPCMPRPVRHSAPATSPASTAARVLDAAEGLRQRAERAGAPGAADTPVAVSPDAAAAVPAATARVNQPAQPAVAGRTASPEGGSAALIVRALQRLSAQPANPRRTGSAPVGGSAVRGPVRGGGATVDFDAGGDLARSVSAPAPAPASGLRRLLAFRTDAELPPDSVRGPAPRPAAPSPAGVVEARMREAELAESLDRLLRREARRQGIDVEGTV